MIFQQVTINTAQANAACSALSLAVIASDMGDSNTWHNGLGADDCEFCQALIVLRSAAGIAARDHLRP